MAYYQNEDGGFANGLEIEYQGNVSSPFTTAAALSYIYFFKLKGTKLEKETLEYLKKTQKNDGCWDDDEKMLEFDLPPYMGPGIYLDYKTASVLKWLVKLGYGETDMAKKALDFLVKYFDKVSEGSDFWSAAAYISAFSEIPTHPKFPEVLKWCNEVFAQSMPPQQSDEIPWMQVQGMIYEDSPALFPIKSKILESIGKNQLPNGAWPHQFGDYNATWAAIFICRFLNSSDNL